MGKLHMTFLFRKRDIFIAPDDLLERNRKAGEPTSMATTPEPTLSELSDEFCGLLEQVKNFLVKLTIVHRTTAPVVSSLTFPVFQRARPRRSPNGIL